MGKEHETVIKGIYNFRAGYSASYSLSNYNEWKWWNLLDNLIDVPIGTALSGGVDSSAIIGGMAYAKQKNILIVI